MGQEVSCNNCNLCKDPQKISNQSFHQNALNQENKDINLSYVYENKKQDNSQNSMIMLDSQHSMHKSETKTSQQDSQQKQQSNLKIQQKEQKYIQRIAQLSKLVGMTPILNIQVKKNNQFQLSLTINAQGYKYSERKKFDGFTFFGITQEKSLTYKTKYENNNIINDFIFAEQYQLEDTYNGQHFQIKYNIEENKYFVKDLQIGFGLFTQVQELQSLEDTQCYSLGNTIMVIKFLSQNSMLQSQQNVSMTTYSNYYYGDLQLSIMDQISSTIKNYNFEKILNNIITIGSGENCNIKLDDEQASEVQCSIIYSENFGWQIYDGGILKGSKNLNPVPSQNGTWLYIAKSTELTQNMILKSNFYKFYISIIYPNYKQQ